MRSHFEGFNCPDESWPIKRHDFNDHQLFFCDKEWQTGSGDQEFLIFSGSEEGFLAVFQFDGPPELNRR